MKTRRVTSHFFLGISLQASGEVISVDDVLARTPAAIAKMRIGDVIESINGLTTTSINAIPSRLRRTNNVGVRRARRTIHFRVRGVDVASDREVAKLLVGKGDRVPGLGHIYLDRHCNAACNCVDDGMACEIWYSFEGEGKQGGVLLKEHCRSLERDWDDNFKYKWVEKKCTDGPRECF
jgi:hypothetical protein